MKNIILTLMCACLVLIGCQQTTVSDEQIDSASQPVLNGFQVNEVTQSSKIIELFNAGTVSVNLSSYKVATGSVSGGINTVDTANSCVLSGTLAAGAYTVVRHNCNGASNCIQCTTLSWGNPDLVNGVDGPAKRTFNVLTSTNTVFESVTYPDTDGTPVQSCTCTNHPVFGYRCDSSVPPVGYSWAATPNGGDCFRVASPTPGAVN